MLRVNPAWRIRPCHCPERLGRDLQGAAPKRAFLRGGGWKGPLPAPNRKKKTRVRQTPPPPNVPPPAFDLNLRGKQKNRVCSRVVFVPPFFPLGPPASRKETDGDFSAPKFAPRSWWKIGFSMPRKMRASIKSRGGWAWPRCRAKKSPAPPKIWSPACPGPRRGAPPKKIPFGGRPKIFFLTFFVKKPFFHNGK